MMIVVRYYLAENTTNNLVMTADDIKDQGLNAEVLLGKTPELP